MGSASETEYLILLAHDLKLLNPGQFADNRQPNYHQDIKWESYLITDLIISEEVPFL